MNFVFFDDIDQSIQVDLQVLKRDSQRNNILLYRHERTLVANDAGIGNAGDLSSYLKFMFNAKKPLAGYLFIRVVSQNFK
jgi:hypothetical protein